MAIPTALEASAPHVDHDMSLFLKLHKNGFWFRFYPETTRRSLHVAYATLFRSLIVFFHGRRPNGKIHDRDLRAIQYINIDVNASGDPFGDWQPDEVSRLDDADKLAAHLSMDRDRKKSDWGSPEDYSMIRPKIQKMLNQLDTSTSKKLFPETARLLGNSP